MTRKAAILKAHQDVLHALVHLDLELASEAPDDDPYRETIKGLISEFGTAINAIKTTE